jgi:hypothetical protein
MIKTFWQLKIEFGETGVHQNAMTVQFLSGAPTALITRKNPISKIDLIHQFQY